jgi:hypothetical protein
MKKTPSLAVILFLTCSAHAQTFISKAGLTLSSIATDDDSDQKIQPGFTIGAAFNFRTSEIFSVQSELTFIQKGGKSERREEEPILSYVQKGKVSLNYLEIPVLLKATFGESTKFFLNAGPSIGIGLNGKFESKITINSILLNAPLTETSDGKVKFGEAPEEEEEDIVYIDNRLDFGLQLGAGVIIADKVVIDLRYGMGLTSMNDKTESEDNKAQNRVIQFTLGVPIQFKNK